LFISPAIDRWDDLAAAGIDVIIDLEGGLDECIPTDLNHCLYVYFPIADDNEEMPPLTKLRAVARLGAELIAEGHRVLSHCGMGFNRSALVAGMILVEMGVPGTTVVERLQSRRPGALFNDRFAEFLRAEPARTALRT
jgi:protein-tyrosine phosphatase